MRLEIPMKVIEKLSTAAASGVGGRDLCGIHEKARRNPYRPRMSQRPKGFAAICSRKSTSDL